MSNAGANPDAHPLARSVSFKRSDKTATWTPKAGSLLDFAEQSGIAMDSSCRSGECGTCSAFLLEGEIAFYSDPGEKFGPGLHKTCCSFPKTDIVLDA